MEPNNQDLKLKITLINMDVFKDDYAIPLKADEDVTEECERITPIQEIEFKVAKKIRLSLAAHELMKLSNEDIDLVVGLIKADRAKKEIVEPRGSNEV